MNISAQNPVILPVRWFAGHEARLIWRDFTSLMTGGKPQRTALVFAIIGGFAIAIHAYAAWLLGPAVEAGIGPTPQTLMIVGGSLVMFVSLMISQAIESVTRAYYARDDLDLILTSPASAERLFHVRTSILAVQTVALSVFIASPAINVLAWLDGPKWLSAYGVLISLGLMSTAFSVALTLVLFRFLGPQRTRLIAQIVAAIIGAGFVIALQGFAIIFGQGVSRFAFFESAQNASAMPALDSAWWIPVHGAMGNGAALAFMLVLGFAVLALTVSFSARRFATDVLAAAGLREPQAKVTVFKGFARNQNLRAGLRKKEWRLLARDPWLVSQTLQQILYLVPPALLLYVNYGSAEGVDTVVVPVIVMAAGQLAGGLAWLSISGEDAHELIVTAPVKATTVLRAKIEAVMVVITWVLVPFAAVLAMFSPWAGAVVLAGGAGASACAVFIQLMFRSQAKRSLFRRRQVSSRAATICEALASIFCAATAAVLLLAPILTWLPMIGVGLVMLFAWLLRPSENRV
ncbi:hypothetical protein [Ahrensia sp. R2A130]|uniref:hypothetical protein n=1 Tax=Ahrensia sp. R2A130 TaxID=744979 RepID=UPI0001E0B482|nr:hypothetical protein [Ahrensia sp. R2A130]EFL90720.1 putative permease [Ahrensia sp. R2A130]